MTRKVFSEHTGIPVRTLEDWEDSRTMATVMVIKQKTDGIDMIQVLEAWFIVNLEKLRDTIFSEQECWLDVMRLKYKMDG